MSGGAVAADEREPAPRHRPVGGLLRTGDFALLWVGQSTSAVGSAMTTVALPLVAISTLHAGPAMVALLTAATWLPWLLIGLPTGVWVDRWPRRRTLLIADVVSAALLLVIPIAAWTGVLTTTMLAVAALLAGSAGVFANVAFNAFLPHLVSAEDLTEGNAKLQTSASVALVVGPGLGGLLAQAAGAVSGILIDALTFLVSAACLLGLRSAPESHPSTGDPPRMLRQIAEGIGFIMRGRLLQAMLVVAAVTNFAMLGITVMTMTFRGTFVPARLLGRVTAASRIFVFGTIPFGAATAGLLASALGIRAAMWALAVLYVIAPLPLLATETRRLRDFPAQGTPDAVP